MLASRSTLPPTGTGQGDGLATLIRHVLAHVWLAAAVAALAFAGLAVLILGLPPIYRAEVLLLLPSASVDDTRRTADEPSTIDPFRLRSEMDILSSELVIREVIAALGLAADPRFSGEEDGAGPGLLDALRRRVAGAGAEAAAPPARSAEIAVANAIGAYREELGAFNDGRSLSAYVSFSDEDPVLAAQVANAHAQAYIDLQMQRRVLAQQRVVDLIDAELARRASDLEAAQAAVDAAAGTALARREAASDLASARIAFEQTAARLADAGAALRNGVLQSVEFVATDAKLISPAAVPIRKDRPRTSLFLAAAAVLSGAIGAAAALARARRTGRTGRLGALVTDLGVPLLAELPRPHRGWGARRRTDALRRERIRFVRDALLGRLPEDAIVLVVPVVPGSRATAVADGLGRSFSATGRRTLLVGADPRAPRGVADDGEPGLAEILAGAATLETGPGPGDDAPLVRLGPGRHPGGIDAMASDALPELAARLRADFRTVILDGASPLSASEAMNLARVADATVLVVDGLRATAGQIERCLSLLEGADIHPDGAILTRARADAAGPARRSRHDPPEPTQAAVASNPEPVRPARPTSFKVVNEGRRP